MVGIQIASLHARAMETLLEIREKMNIAENSAVTNSSSILGTLHLAIPLGVMGILLVMVLPVWTMIMDLLISLNIALSIVIMPVSCTSGSRCISQSSHHPSFSALPGTRTYL